MKPVVPNTVYIVGLARNVENSIMDEVERITSIFSEIFDNLRIFIVESDSIDNTKQVLMMLKTTKEEFAFQSLGSLESQIPDRIQRLVHCRNVYVKWLRQFDDEALVAVIDFDIKNNKLNASSIRKSLTELPSAAGIFANQSGRYFDIYALRCIGWSESDCQSEYWNLRKLMKPEKAKKIAIWSKMRKVRKSSSPIQVESAFGGLGIYKKSVFSRFDYTPENDFYTGESEHVYLHKKIRKSGAKLFISPILTNFSWSPHNLSSFRVLRELDRISKSSILKSMRMTLQKHIQ